MTKAVVLAVLLAVAGCGGSKPGPERPPGDGSGSAVTAPPGDGSGTGDGSAPAASGAITRVECEQIVDHVIDIGNAAQPPDKQLPPEALAESKANMKADAEAMQQCMAFDRPTFDCVMAATAVPALQKCLGE